MRQRFSYCKSNELHDVHKSSDSSRELELVSVEAYESLYIGARESLLHECSCHEIKCRVLATSKSLVVVLNAAARMMLPSLA